MPDLTLKEKIAQMFIAGFEGEDFSSDKYFNCLLELNLGGVIFFSHNIRSKEGFVNLINALKKKSRSGMFYSIDQEGGRVERTENIHGGKKYLSAEYAYEKGLDFLENQTEQIAQELISYGINMNFAPVLDVNTNKNNPIIGERAFSDNPSEVIKAAKSVIKVYEKYSIVTVGKHFPGHGASVEDSHKSLPVINLPEKIMEEIHIKPFESAIKEGIPAIMAAHVLYPSLEEKNYPASVSKSIITDLLRNKLGFSGIVMTDDMEMNGIKGFSKLEACTLAINAGVDMFIFRNSTKEVLDLISDIETLVKDGVIKESSINNSMQRILKIKYRYRIAK